MNVSDSAGTSNAYAGTMLGDATALPSEAELGENFVALIGNAEPGFGLSPNTFVVQETSTHGCLDDFAGAFTLTMEWDLPSHDADAAIAFETIVTLAPEPGTGLLAIQGLLMIGVAVGQPARILLGALFLDLEEGAQVDASVVCG